MDIDEDMDRDMDLDIDRGMYMSTNTDVKADMNIVLDKEGMDRAGHRSSENDLMNQHCQFLPSFLNQSFDNGSSRSFFFPIIRQCQFQPLIF